VYMDTWQTINGADAETARRSLARACGSSRWVDRMLELRPFASQAELLSAARRVWDDLEDGDCGAASSDVLDRLAAGNRDYLARFGYIFIVCASGRSAEEMLAILRSRLDNDAATEIRIAAREQAAITALRLSTRPAV
jgi:2-oxo-4-hydroxy-4-carboxy-5-ureidoimidazoline decarboxylase